MYSKYFQRETDGKVTLEYIWSLEDGNSVNEGS